MSVRRHGLRVGLLGWGAIGAEIGRAIRRGDIPGVELTAVAASHPHEDVEALQVSPAELAERCDLVVEAASQQALIDHGADVLTVARTCSSCQSARSPTTSCSND